MTWRRTILAGFIFAAMLGLYFLDKNMATRRTLEAVNEASLSPGINKSEVTDIRVVNKSGETQLRREGTTWRVIAPTQGEADAEVIEQLLTNVTGARRRNPIEARNVAEFGLAAPESELVLKTDSGKEFHLQLGLTSTYTGQVFARLANGSQVFTVGDHVRNALLRQPADFRRSRLVEVDLANVERLQRVTIENNGRQVELQSAAGKWRLAAPFDAPADREAVTEFLRKASLLRANGFITATSTRPTSLTLAEAALTSPSLRITIAGEKGTFTLSAANAGTSESPVYVARRSDSAEVLALRRETVDELGVTENEFRSRELFSLAAKDVGTFSIEIGNARTDLVRNEQGRWEFLGDRRRRVNQTEVENRLEALLRSRVREYVESNPRDISIYKLTPPRFRYTVVSRDRTRTESIEAGGLEPGRGQTNYARRRNDTSVFTMDLTAEIIITADTVAEKTIVSLEFPKIRRMDVDFAGSIATLRRNANDWEILRSGQTVYTKADVPRLERMLEALYRLEFERDFTADGDRIIAPAEKPVLTLSFYGEGDTLLESYTLGKRLPGTTFVTTQSGSQYEVKNAPLDRIVAMLRTLVQ